MTLQICEHKEVSPEFVFYMVNTLYLRLLFLFFSATNGDI